MQELMALGWWWLLIGYGIGAVLAAFAAKVSIDDGDGDPFIAVMLGLWFGLGWPVVMPPILLWQVSRVCRRIFLK